MSIEVRDEAKTAICVPPRGGNFFSPAELSYERHEW